MHTYGVALVLLKSGHGHDAEYTNVLGNTSADTDTIHSLKTKAMVSASDMVMMLSIQMY